MARNKPRIVVILPRGETFRNFLYTGAFDELAREAEVTALSVIPSPAFEQLLRERFHRVIPLQSVSDRWPVRITREILEMAHARQLWSAAQRERWFWRDEEANTASRWLKRTGRKLACYPFANQAGLDLLSHAEHWGSWLLRPTDEYRRLLDEVKPALVFNASHVHSQNAAHAMHAARRMKIPTATFLFSWDNLTSQGRIMPPCDHYLVWNDAIREQLLSIYPAIAPSHVYVTGTPQFDTHFREQFHWTREEFCARVGADPARPIVLYSTGMANHMPGEPLIVERIAAMLREMTEFGPPQLLLRVYPKDTSGRFEDLKRRLPGLLAPEVPWEPNWLTPKLDDAYLLANSLRHAATGVNIASTVSLELCMFDKPVINVGYNPPGMDIRPIDFTRYYHFDHYKPIVESGAIAVARDEDEMKQMIANALRNPGERTPQRAALLHSFFGDSLDGQSSSRVAQTLLNLAR